MELLLRIITKSQINIDEHDSNDIQNVLAALCGLSKLTYDKVNMIKILLKLNTDIDFADVDTNMTLLMHICSSYNADVDRAFEIVEEILKYNPNINIEDSNGKTAFDHAKDVGNNEIIELLKKYNINIINVLKSENEKLKHENNILKKKFEDLHDDLDSTKLISFEKFNLIKQKL